MPADSQLTRPPDTLARALGLLSAALAPGPLVRPGALLRGAGLDDTPGRRAAARIGGARESAAAIGLLRSGGPGWLWVRAVGDVMDLAALARWTARSRGRRSRALAAIAAIGAVTAVDFYAAVSRSRAMVLAATGATTIGKPPDQVYAAWRDLERLPEFMAHLDQVRVTGPRTSRWRTAPVAGRGVEWDAEIAEEIPGELLAWRSVGDADVRNEGAVRFDPAPGGRGTEVHVRLVYWLPGGPVGRLAARLLGEEPRQQLDDDLRRFKQVVETGEVIRSEGAPAGKRAGREFPQRPARPLSADERGELLV